MDFETVVPLADEAPDWGVRAMENAISCLRFALGTRLSSDDRDRARRALEALEA